jgi:CofD-related protein of GAK system
VAELEDGTILRGQHMITGKEVHAIHSPVRSVWLTADLDTLLPVEAPISDKTKQLIASADLICYPMGSFYTSVMANLLPTGVGGAVAENRCPKIYIPSLGNDPETLGLGLFESTRRLLQALETSAGQSMPPSHLLNFVLLDTANGAYPEPMELEKFSSLGIQVIDARLVSKKSAPLLDESLLIRHLLSLV